MNKKSKNDKYVHDIAAFYNVNYDIARDYISLMSENEILNIIGEKNNE
jgi:predicted transcriptional regulator